MEVLDAHYHLGFASAEPAGTSGEGTDLMALDYKNRIASMRQSGVHRAVLGPQYWIATGSPSGFSEEGYAIPNGVADTRRLNDRIAAYRDQDRECFPFAIGAIEPRHAEQSLDEIDRIADELGMVGVMWHNRLQGTYVDSPWMRKYVRKLADKGLTPFVHCHPGSILEAAWRVERLAREVPTATFVILDGLSGYEETEHLLEIAVRQPNLVFDTGMWMGGSRKVEMIVRTLGAHRLVLGSGMVAAVREANISEKEKAQVSALNLYGILKQAPRGELSR